MSDWTPTEPIPSPAEVRAARTPKGGWTRAQLAEWGVPFEKNPPRGWQQKLAAAWREKHPEELL